jgi:hypothetical protein
MRVIKIIKLNLRIIGNIKSIYRSMRNEINKNYLQTSILSTKIQRMNYTMLDDLRQAELKVFSQNGEDGIIDYCLETIGVKNINFLELGSSDFVECNSRFCNLLRNSGTYLVDSKMDINKLRNDFEDRFINSKIFCKNAWISTDNINNIIQDATIKLGRLNVLSIDLDGNDYWILKNILDLDFDLIIVEYNPTLSSNLPVSVPYDTNFDRTKKHYTYKYYGATLEAYVQLLKKRNFKFIGATSQGTNAFFVSNVHASKFQKVIKSVDDYKNVSSREARNRQGVLSFISIEEERYLIKDLPLEETEI